MAPFSFCFRHTFFEKDYSMKRSVLSRRRVRPNLQLLDDRVVPSQLVWEDHLDLGNFEQAFSVAPLEDQVFVSGFTSNTSGSRDFLIRAYDVRTGDLRWRDRLDKGSDDFASGVATDENRVFVSGNFFVPGHGYDWIVRAYEAGNGTLLWESVFDFAGKDDVCRGTALALAEGMLYLGGYVYNTDGNQDWLVRAYDTSSGDLVWQDQRDVGGFSDGVRELIVKNGSLFVAGWGHTSVGNAVVRAYDAKTGGILWDHSTPGEAPVNTFAPEIEVEENRVFVGVALTDASGEQHSLVQAYHASTGALLWQNWIDKGGEIDFLQGMVARDGRLHTVGFGGPACLWASSPPSNCDGLIFTHDTATGALLWERVADLSAGLDDFTSVVAAEKGILYAASEAGAYQNDFGTWTVQAFDSSTGKRRWQSIGGSGETPVYNMIIHRGRLVIPGRAVDPLTDNWDWLVRAYNIRDERTAPGGRLHDKSISPDAHHLSRDEERIWSSLTDNDSRDRARFAVLSKMEREPHADTRHAFGISTAKLNRIRGPLSDKAGAGSGFDDALWSRTFLCCGKSPVNDVASQIAVVHE
jgi:hypothetical protein